MQKNNTTKQEILNAAEHLFSEKGYDATSIQDITKRVGITKPSFFYYFKTKSDIFIELMQIRREEAIQSFMEKSERGEILKSKEELYKACIAFINENQKIFRIAIFEFLKTNIGTNIIMELPKEVFSRFGSVFEFTKEEKVSLIVAVIKTIMFSSICQNLCHNFDISQDELKTIYNKNID